MRAPTAQQGMDWNLLIATLVRERPSSVISLDGQASLDFDNPVVPPQIFKALLYPHILLRNEKGLIYYLPEGVGQHVTHVILCNLVVDFTPNAATLDIQFMDRVTDQRGNHYRVLAVLNDAGQNHHYVIPCCTLSPTGDV